MQASVYYPQSKDKIECFHRTIKTEAIRKRSHLSIDDAREQIANYIGIFTEDRLRGALFYLTPKEIFRDKMKE